MRNYTKEDIRRALNSKGIKYREVKTNVSGFILNARQYEPEEGLELIRIFECSGIYQIGTLLEFDEEGEDFFVSGFSRSNNDPCKYMPVSWLIPRANTKPEWL